MQLPKFPVPVERKLANGLRVVAVDRPGQPLVSAALVITHGPESDAPDLAGLASFTMQLSKQGTATRSATQIAAEVDALGASLGVLVLREATGLFFTNTLSAQLDPTFALLADLVRNPKFAPDEVERLRRQTLDSLRLSLEEPHTVASVAASKAILGGSLYAQPLTGTLRSVARFGRKDIVSLYARYYSPGDALLVMAGNVTPEAGFALAEKYFGDWQASKGSTSPSLEFQPAPGPRAILIDMPHAGQAAVLLGAPSIARNRDEYFVGALTEAVLGTGYSSRLNQEIRLKRGLSYGASSTLEMLRGGGFFQASCQTKNESAAEVARLVQNELQRLGTELVPSEYLAARRAVLTGSFARALETNAGYVLALTDLALYGFPLEWVNEYFARVEGVTAEEVRAFAARHFAPESMSVIVAGRAAICAKPLRETFSNLEIIPQSELDLDSAKLRRRAKR